MKRRLIEFFWRYYRDYLLNIKGFTNNTIHNDKDFLSLFMKVYSEKRAELTIRDMYNIYVLVKKAKNIPGDIAEVGVYKGGSARIICASKGDKALHLFDTFEGMPEVSHIDKHRKGDFFDTSLEGVKEYLQEFNNLYFYKGRFPCSAIELERKAQKFCMVNIDVDIYESTLNCLKFFYPRLSRSGIMLSHDYRAISCPGVKKAFDEFFSDKPETVVELWDTQCIVIKL